MLVRRCGRLAHCHASNDSAITRRCGSVKLRSMSAPESSGGRTRRPPARRQSAGMYDARRPATGSGVTTAPSVLDLEDEDTVTYDARRTPAVSLPALLAECAEGRERKPIGVRLHRGM